MKTYKDFEKKQLGGSDCARLILSCDRLEYLYFGSDEDEERTLKVSGDKIEIYRAGDFGCIIYAPGGSCCRW